MVRRLRKTFAKSKKLFETYIGVNDPAEWKHFEEVRKKETQADRV